MFGLQIRRRIAIDYDVAISCITALSGSFILDPLFAVAAEEPSQTECFSDDEQIVASHLKRLIHFFAPGPRRFTRLTNANNK